jgi:ElaB/YqjD/DUF883 family membrane-anchored ribosome-binding protein
MGIDLFKGYELYMLQIAEKELEAAQRMKFFRVSLRSGACYILVYAKEADVNGLTLYGENAPELNSTDLQWLMECRETLIQESAKDAEEEIHQNNLRFLKRWESELKKERKEAKANGDHSEEAAQSLRTEKTGE